ncbi:MULTISPECIES: hypothetical protein [Haloarcula]|nr:MULTISPECIES: hypothetical protein [Halomicroarcula]MBX0348814.1 hypothetical protein [Halomicroarcula pellucida]MDS0278577.1 hypothetical protein [Halomicroarcula sp. S1AR25-4]QIO20957.1 hypothetical protein G9465_00655 [Haloarcula sp. JP-L23]
MSSHRCGTPADDPSTDSEAAELTHEERATAAARAVEQVATALAADR